MEIEGLCRDCQYGWFDAHWHKFPNGVYCPGCKSKNVRIVTDETDDLKRDAWEAKHGRIEDDTDNDEGTY